MRPRDWAKKRFCTQKCSAKVPWRRMNSPTLEPKVCENCGKKYLPKDRNAYEAQRHCSRECAKATASREARSKWEQRECPICGKTFGVRPGHRHITCGDPDCVSQYRKGIGAQKLSERIKADFASGKRKPGRGYSERERLVWEYLRGRGWFWRLKWCQDDGWVEIDLAHFGKQLAVELDGPEHDWPKHRARDEARDAELTRRGWKILRIPNHEVDASPEDVARRILDWAS